NVTGMPRAANASASPSSSVVLPAPGAPPITVRPARSPPLVAVFKVANEVSSRAIFDVPSARARSASVTGVATAERAAPPTRTGHVQQAFLNGTQLINATNYPTATV